MPLSQGVVQEYGQNLFLNFLYKSEYCSVVSDSLRPQGLYSPWDSPGQSTGVGSLSLLQGTFWIGGLNLGLPHCRWIFYQLSYKGSPRIREWVVYPFSRGSSQLRDWNQVSHIAGRFFTSWATREAQWFVQKKKRIMDWDFLGGPVVKTLSLWCRGPGFNPWSGN